MQWLFIGLAILAGLSNPVQSAANGGLNKALGQVLPAALVVYAVALVGLAVCVPFFGVSPRDAIGKLSAVPWWAWLGGLCNLIFVVTATLATPRVGSAVFTVATACTAVLLSIVLDRLGVMGLPVHPISVLRLVGAALSVAGIALVALS